MGTDKKEAARKERQGKVGDGMNNVKTKGENFYRYVREVRSVVVLYNKAADKTSVGRRRRRRH